MAVAAPLEEAVTVEVPTEGQEEEVEDTETTAGMTVTGDITTTAPAVTTVTTDDGTDPDPGTGTERGRERGMGADPAGTGTAGVSRATGDDHHGASTAMSTTPGAGGTKTAGIRGSRAATGHPGIEMVSVMRPGPCLLPWEGGTFWLLANVGFSP